MRFHNFLRRKQSLPPRSSPPKECLHSCFWHNLPPKFSLSIQKCSAPNKVPAPFSLVVLHVTYMDFFPTLPYPPLSLV